MSLQSAPFFWLTCDGPGCAAQSPDGDEVIAWQDAEQAVDCAESSEWLVTDDGRHLCEMCRAVEDADDEDEPSPAPVVCGN